MCKLVGQFLSFKIISQCGKDGNYSENCYLYKKLDDNVSDVFVVKKRLWQINAINGETTEYGVL